MRIYDPHITGSLSVSSSAEIQGDLVVSGTIYGTAQIDGQVQDAVSASHAEKYLLTSSFEIYTASAATTGSNTFIGDQTFSGSLLPQGTTTHDLGSDTLRWNDIYLAGSTVDIGGTKISKDGSGDVEIKDSDGNLKRIIASELEIGTGNNKIKIKRGNNGRVNILDTSDNTELAELSGSFTGSFRGDGSALTNVPASAVTGLSLARIADSSATASISTAGLVSNVSILPDTTDAIDLGSPSKQWRDLYLSSGSLYINGQQVISTTGTELRVTTDSGESIKIIEEGSDTITLQTENGDITLSSSGTGNIELDAPIQITAGNKVLSSDGNSIVFGNGLIITGSITLTGNVDGVDVGTFKSDFDTITGSHNTRITNLESTGSDHESRVGSLETNSGSQATSISDLETFQTTVETGLEFTGSNVTVKGNLLVKGTETKVNSTTVDIDDNIISLNGTGATNAGIEVRDAETPGVLSGSLIYDTGDNEWKAGIKGSEETILLTSDKTEIDGRLNSIETTSGSHNTRITNLESTGSSNVERINEIEFATGSLETKTGSLDTDISNLDGRLDSIETFTGSIDNTYATDADVTSLTNTFNSYTSSNNTTNTGQNSRLTSIETTTGSHNTRITNLESTGSDHESRIDGLETKSGSFETSIGALETFTGSIDDTYASDSDVTDLRNDFNTHTSSNTTTFSQHVQRLTSLENTSGSHNTRIGDLESFSSSLDDTYAKDSDVTGLTATFNTYTSSNDTTNTNQNNRLSSIETKTGSLTTDISNLDGRVDSIETKTGSLDTDISNLDGRVDSIETTTGSHSSRIGALETFTGSIDDTYATDSDVTSLTNTFNSYTSSNNTTNTNQNNRLGAIETKTGSLSTDVSTLQTKVGGLETKSGSYEGRLTSLETNSGSQATSIGDLETFQTTVETGLEFTGSNVTVKGNFLVRGTETRVNSTTVDIDDNIISLNGTGATDAGIEVRDTESPGGTSGSLIYDTGENEWKAGLKGSEETILLSSDKTEIDGRLGSLETKSGSLETSVNSLNVTTGSHNTRITNLESTGSDHESRLDSLQSKTSSLDTDISNLDGRLDSIEVETGSINSSITSLNSFSSSINTTIKTKLNTEQVVSGSEFKLNDTSPITQYSEVIVTATGGVYYIDGTSQQTLSLTKGITYRFDLSSNTLSGHPFRFATDNGGNSPYTDGVTVNGTEGNNGAYVQIITSQDTPTTLYYYCTNHNGMGGKVIVGSHEDTDTIDEGSNNLYYTDTRVKSKLNTEGVISGSVQVSITGTTGYNLVDGRLDSLETFTGSIDDTYATDSDVTTLRNDLNTYTQSNDTTNINQNDRLNSIETKTGSLEGNIGSIHTFTSSINTTIKNKLNTEGVISGSEQIDHDATTNYSANEHIDHSTITIGSGKGLTGGGTIDTSRSLELATGSNHFLDGVKSKLNSEGILSGSVQVSITGTTGYNLVDGRLDSLETKTGSLDGDISTLDGRVDSLESATGSYLTQHPNISAASTSDNSGRTYIQDITLDSNGHVIGLATATETVVNTDEFVTGATWNNSNAVLTFTRNDGDTFNVTLLDTLSDVTVTGGTYNSGNQTLTLTKNDGNTVDVSGFAIDTDVNYYLTGATWATGTGVLTLSVKGSSDVTVDLDGRYLTSFTETDPIFTAHAAYGITSTNISNWNTAYGWGDHSVEGYLTSHPSISAASSSNNGGRTYIQDILLDSNGHVTGITTATETVTNTDTIDYINSATFNTGNGIITGTGVGNAGFTVDIDGRYLQLSGGNMTGNISFNDDGEGIEFYSTNSLKKVVGTGMVLEVDSSRSDNLVLQIKRGTTYDYMWHTGHFTSTNVSNWDTAYGWGDHSTAGYLTSHPSISAASSSNNSGRTYIQDILLDSNGHVTGITTATESVTNTDEYTTGATFNTGNGIITFTRNDGDTYTVDIDGRFLTSYTETDPVFTAHAAYGITSTKISNWDTAYGWGDHSVEGYLTSHPSISAASSSNNSGRTYIQDITLDGNGHVTGIATATETVVNTDEYTTGVTFNSVNGILTFTRNDGDTYTVDISDTLSEVTVTGGTYDDSTQTLTLTKSDGNTVDVTGFALDTDVNYYLTGATFSTGNGVLTLSVKGSSDVTVDLDGRYLTEHPLITGAASSSNNSGRTYIQDILLDGNGHVTGITTATETVVNTDEYTTGATFNTSNGIITFTRNDGDTYTVDIDGKYAESGHNHDGSYIKDGGTSAIGNIDNIGTESIKHRWNSSTVGRPASGQSNEYGTVTTLTYDSTYATQIAWDIDQGNLYGRTLNKSTDSGTWVKFWNDTDFSSTQVSNWDDAYGWGDHSTQGYLTTETYTQHDNISAASSSDNSGRTYIQDILLDSNGHVTGITTATETVTNTNDIDYISSASFNTGTGVITGTGTGNASFTVDIDGRYLPLAGGTVTGNIDFNDSGEGIVWSMNTDGAGIKFYNTGDSDTNSRLEYYTSDNGNEYHSWLISSVQEMTLKSDGLRVTNDIYASGGNSTQWNLAYGWGDHSLEGYVTNDEYTTGATWNSGTGVLTFTRNDGDTFNVTLVDTLSDVTVTGGTYNSSNQTLTLTKSDGNTVDVSGFAIDTDTNDIDYINSASFSNGTLTLSGVGNAGASVSLDGRYLQSYTETDTLADVIGRGNTTTSYISFTGNGTDTGIRFNNATVSNDAAGIRQNGTSNAGELEFFTTDDDDEPFVFRHYTTGQDGSGTSAEWFRIGASGNVTAQGTVTATGGNSTQWNSAYTYSQVGHLPLAGGTMSGSINLNNNNITGVNHIQINDPGAGEGIEWAGGSGFKIYEADNALGNNAGNLQFVVGSTRILTLGSNGQSEFTDKLTLTSSTSGSTIFDIQGTSGQLFSITDDLTGDIFSVSDGSGVPIFNVNADGTVTLDSLGSLYVGNNKVINGSGNIEFDGPVTTTNQGRGIYWTAYDKEGTADLSDTAHILHTTNSGGLSGSVIEIKSHNDATDGVNFVVNGNSAVRINGNIVVHAGNYTSYQQHPTISAASSSNNSGRTYIQDITLDSNGHVTGIQTATETVTNTNDIDYINSASFSSGTLTLSGVGNAGASVSLDGRYLLDTTDTFTGALTIDGDIRGDGSELILNAGESAGYATGQTGERIYLNAEAGIWVSTSPDNWASGWSGKKESSLTGTQLTIDGETLTKTNIQNFKTAYGWGDHSGLYAKRSSATFTGTGVSFTHNIGHDNVIVQVYDSNGDLFFPSSINVASGVATVTFETSRSGRIVVVG